jgi:hypothetical protein
MVEHNKSNNTALIIIGIVIASLLGYLIFKEDINNYNKRNKIISHASIANIPQLNISCSLDSEGVDCQNYLSKYSPKIQTWNEMIKAKKDISCSDFYSHRDAWDFFDYVSGEAVQYAKQLGITDYKNIGMMYLNYKLKCEYDPYGLDTNNDCWPCKNFNY